jgi:hypothetical protein
MKYFAKANHLSNGNQSTKTNPMKKIALLCCGLLTAAAMQAQIIYVHHDSLHSTIQSGINAANPGDTVLVSEGTYFEQINFLGKKPLMVASRFLMDGDTSHIGKTIIDGSLLANMDSASVVYFISGEDSTSVLCGFTVQNGRGTSWFWEGYESIGGGGIYISRSTAFIRNNIIKNNMLNDTLSPEQSGSCGGGIHVSYGFPATVVIEGNNIFSNTVFSNHLWTEGGGVYIFATNSAVRNNLISKNISKNIQDSIDYAHGTAGGIICEGDTIPVIANVINNRIEENETYGQMTGYGGGMGLWVLAGGSVISNNVFKNNSHNWYGGGIDILSLDSNVIIENNYFIGNSARYGGAIEAYDWGSYIYCLNNVFISNIASEQGGAFWLNRMDGGTAANFAVLINNSFYNNQAGLSGSSIYSYDYNPLIINSIHWKNSDLDGNVIAVDSGTVEIAYSDLDTNNITGNRIIGPGMIKSDPLFSDITLLTTEHWSPCVDKGVAQYTCANGETFQSPQHDIIGISRPVGAGFDMGAYDIKAWGPGVGEISDFGFRISNWPNPFNSSTTFSFTLTEPSSVTLHIFNNFGQLVAEPVNATQVKGEQTLQWNSGNLPAGIYFYYIQAGKQAGSGKVVKY